MNLPNPESLSTQDYDLRCPHCGKRVTADMLVCPMCARELVPHKARVSCRHCGSRVLAEATRCPRCGHDPRPKPASFKIPRWIPIVVAVILLVCIGWIIFRALTTNILGRALGSNPTPTAETQTVEKIYVVATPIPPSPTLTRTSTPTPAVTPSITRPGMRAATVAPTKASAPSGFYLAVPLVAPLNATVYTGVNANIILQWQNVAPNGLRENEWYEIKLTYTARDGTPGERKSYSKETSWGVANDWYGEIAPAQRAIKWTVTVVRVDANDPLTTTNRVPISANGTIRTFYWN